MNKKIFAKFLFDNKAEDSEILKQTGISQHLLNSWKVKWRLQSHHKDVSNLKYHTEEYKQLRRQCFERDGHKCIFCGSTKILQMDHIKPQSVYPELRFSINNVRTLCYKCHRKTETWGRSGIRKYVRRLKK